MMIVERDRQRETEAERKKERDFAVCLYNHLSGYSWQILLAEWIDQCTDYRTKIFIEIFAAG